MARKPRDYDAELQALMSGRRRSRRRKPPSSANWCKSSARTPSPSKPSPARSSPPSSRQRKTPKLSRGGPNAAQAFFSKAASGGNKPQPATLLAELQATTARLRRLTVLRNRLDLARARADTRQWVQDRRARTRHLIELGGLVQKAGLVELADDDRATLLGAFLGLAARLHSKRMNAKQ